MLGSFSLRVQMRLFKRMGPISSDKSYPIVSYPFIYIHQLYINPIYIYFVITGFPEGHFILNPRHDFFVLRKYEKYTPAYFILSTIQLSTEEST